MLYEIYRDCCTSGNCIVCKRKAPLGQTVRVRQTWTHDKQEAERIADNWKLYKAKVVAKTGDA
jgi:hypothetical protein